MINKDGHIGLSPTVLQVIEQFTARMHADNSIGDDAADRIEKLLRKPIIPKPDEINAAIFDLSREGEP